MQLIFPILDYADVVYGNTFETNLRPHNVFICMYIIVSVDLCSGVEFITA